MTLDLCEVYKEYATNRRRILNTILPYYIYNLLEKGEYGTALTIMHNALNRGVLPDSLKPLYTKLYELEKLTNVTNQLLDEENKLIGKIENGTLSNSDLDELNSYIKKLVSVIGEATSKGVNTGNYAIKLNEALDLYALLKRYLMVKSEYKTMDNILKSINEPNPTPEDYENVVNKLLELYRHAVNVSDFIGKTMLLTGTYKSFLDSLKKQSKNVLRQIEALVTLYKTTAKDLRDISKLNDLLSKYGGDNNLMNPTYVGNVYNAILDVMGDILNAKSCESTSACTLGKDKLITVWDSIGESLTKYLNTLKMNLASVDDRWLKLFNQAENSSGVHLINVTVNEGWTGKLEDVVKEARESALNLLHSSDAWKKVWGALAMVGAGAMGTLSSMVNPKEFVEQLKDMITGVYHAGEDVVNGNLEKVKNEGESLFKNMFGTPENALYTTGMLLAFEMGGRVAGRLPLPTRVKAVVESMARGDPIGATVNIMKDARVVTGFREAVEFLPQETTLWEKLMSGFKDKLTDNILKKFLERSTKAIIRDNASLLRKKIGEIVVKPNGLKELDEAVKKAVMEIGIGKAVDTALRYEKTLADLLGKTNGMLSDILKRNEIGGIRVPRELKTYTIIESMKKALPEMTKSLDEVLSKEESLSKLLEDLKPFMNEDEWLKLKNELKNVDISLAKARLSQAKSILEQLNEELGKGGNIKTTLYNIADKLEEAGYKDLARKVRSGDVESLYNALKNGVIKLDKDTALLLGTIDKVVGELVNNKLLNKTMLETLDRVDELVVDKAGELPIMGLQDKILGIIDLLKNKNIPSELKASLEKLESKVRREGGTLDDLEELSETVANYSPQLASLVDMGIVTRLMDEAVSYVRNELKDTPVYKYLSSDMDKITEIESRLGKVSETVTRTLGEVNNTLKDSLYKLADYVDSIDHDTATRLRDSIDNFLEAVSKGDEKAILEASKELYNSIDKATRLAGGLTDRLRDTLVGLKNTLMGKLGFKNKVLEDVYRRLASYIGEDLEKLPQVPEGYGYIMVTGTRKAFTPVLARLEDLKKIREILSKKHVDRVVDIGGREFHVARDINILPDGTMELLYRAESPTGSWLEYRYVVKPKGKGEADVYTYTNYDPRLKTELMENPELKNVFERDIEEGSLIRELDPDFDMLSRIVIEKPSGLYRLGELMVTGVKESLPLLLTTTNISSLPLDWKLALSSGKLDLLEQLKPYIRQVSNNIKTALESIDLDPLGKVQCCGKTAIIVRPIDFKKNIFKEFVFVKMNGKTIPLPVVNINGEDYIVIPNIDINTIVLPDEKQLLVTLQQQGYKTETVTFNPPSKEKAKSGITPIVPPIPPLPVAVGTSKQGGKGLQYEVLEL